MDALADFADRDPVDDDGGDEAGSGRLGLSPNECIGEGGREGRTKEGWTDGRRDRVKKAKEAKFYGGSKRHDRRRRRRRRRRRPDGKLMSRGRA